MAKIVTISGKDYDFDSLNDTAQKMATSVAAADARQAWHAAFVEPIEDLCRALPGRRVRVQVLATDDASDAWLSATPNRSVG